MFMTVTAAAPWLIENVPAQYGWVILARNPADVADVACHGGDVLAVHNSSSSKGAGNFWQYLPYSHDAATNIVVSNAVTAKDCLCSLQLILAR
jgi:hypothetical protein